MVLEEGRRDFLHSAFLLEKSLCNGGLQAPFQIHVGTSKESLQTVSLLRVCDGCAGEEIALMSSGIRKPEPRV